MSNALRTYFRGRNLVSMRDQVASKMAYYHFDHQGTTQCLTDNTGAVTDRFASDAWGVQVKRTGTSINRSWYIGNFGYTRQVDQLLDYVRVRFYTYLAGQWVSRDPITGQHGYSYGGNAPSQRIDPTGLLSCTGGTVSPSWLQPMGVMSLTASLIGSKPGDPFTQLISVMEYGSIKLTGTIMCALAQGESLSQLQMWQWKYITEVHYDPATNLPSGGPSLTVPASDVGAWTNDGVEPYPLTYSTFSPPETYAGGKQVQSATLVICDHPGIWDKSQIRSQSKDCVLNGAGLPTSAKVPAYVGKTKTAYSKTQPIWDVTVTVSFCTGIGQSASDALKNATTWAVKWGWKKQIPLSTSQALPFYTTAPAMPCPTTVPTK